MHTIFFSFLQNSTPIEYSSRWLLQFSLFFYAVENSISQSIDMVNMEYSISVSPLRSPGYHSDKPVYDVTPAPHKINVGVSKVVGEVSAGPIFDVSGQPQQPSYDGPDCTPV
jgi:hypothetical protein